MFKKLTFWSLGIILFLLLNLSVAVWVLVRDLKTRFPNLDFSLSRFGVASWYSEQDKFINEKTANGETFDDSALTCASWFHDFGEKLLVINVFSGKWVVCRVNDRGPNKRLNREIDLTKSAFKRISNPRHGLIRVTVTPVDGKNGE